MRRYRWIIPVVILLLGGLITLVLKTQRWDSLPDNQLFASGTIEVTEVEVAFRMPGTLAQRPVDEGDVVKQGALVAALDGREQRSRLRQAEAGVQVARATLEEMQRGFRAEEIAQAESAVQETAVQAQNLRDQAERARQLYAEGGISREQRDREVTAAEAAESRNHAAMAKLRLLKSGYRKEQIAAARARLEQAEAAVETLSVTLQDMTATSPVDGVVTRTHVEVGETIPAVRPVATVAELSAPRLRIYVPELQIGRLRLGAPAEVTVDAFPERRFPGKVSYIASEAEFTPKNVQTREERVKLVFAADIELENPEGILKPGMPADALITLLEQGGTP